VGASAAILAALACGDPDAPSGRELLGTWGSSDAQLVALHAGAELHAGCASFIMDDAIELDEGNGFVARARVFGPGFVVGSLPVVRVRGSVEGSRVTLTVPKSSRTPAGTYVLEQDVTPDPIPCPA
jgi:hypothetical protein